MNVRRAPAAQGREARHTECSRVKSFTLVELLVVIAVIAILAALLLPVLGRAQDKAFSVVCKSNLKQLGLALANYTQQYGAYPVYYTMHTDNPTADDAGFPAWWHQKLEPYSGAKWPTYDQPGAVESPRTKVYQCPSYVRALRQISGSSAGNPQAGMAIGSYGYNWRGVSQDPQSGYGLGGDWTTPNPMFTYQYRATRENDVFKPTLMLAIGDAVFSIVGSGTNSYQPNLDFAGLCDLSEAEWYYFNPSMVLRGAQQWRAMESRHQGRWNVAFCDGHVESFTTKGLLDYNDSIALSRWNKDNLPHRNLLH